MAPLLPKLRGHFAEFLNHSYLDRLSILYLTTCVGLGYGPCESSLEAFLGSIGSPHSPQSAMHQISGFVGHGFACVPPYILTPVLPLTGAATFLRHPIAWLLPGRFPRSTPHATSSKAGATRCFGRLASRDSPWARSHGYGNINPLSIDYACRPRLRSRLTLGGLTWPRNPWSFGGGVSHSPFATHACILTRAASTPGSLRSFPGCTTLPYPSARLHPHPQAKVNHKCECHGFGGVLEPRYIVGAGSLDQ